MKRSEQKEKFIQAVADFLCNDMAMKSIAISVEGGRTPSQAALMPKWATEWSAILSAVPELRGWATREETVEALREFLS